MIPVMAKAVFVQNPGSPYADQPGVAYHFPRLYLSRVQRTVGDWVVFYEGRRGRLGYVSVQKVGKIVADPSREGHFFALMDRASELAFERLVPRARPDGLAFERCLRGPDGAPMSGGANSASVRLLTDTEFWEIVTYGCRPLPDAHALPRDADGAQPGFAEPAAPFAGPPPDIEIVSAPRPEILTTRKWRDAQFARMVKRAYGGRCAISGLDLRNGGGRSEVEACHIRPVKAGGPDTVNNGIALSGTLHWMFDRGLLAVAEDWSILISHNKVPREVADRLIAPDRRLRLPEDPRDWPHPAFLRWHREEVFARA